MKRTAFIWLGIIAIGIAAAACSKNPDVNVTNAPSTTGGGTPQTVATVTVVPSTPAPLLIGNTAQFTANALDASGTAVTSATFTWASSDQTVATISSTGLATGLAAGTTNITATSGTVANNPAVALTVTCAGIPANVSTPTATPSSVSTFGQSAISVTVTDCGTKPVPNGTQVTFAVSPTNIGTVTGGSTNPATTASGVATATFYSG